MDVEPLALSHQALLNHKFSNLNIPFSEYSFANLYLFRKLHRYQLLNCHQELFIKGVTRDQVPFIMLTAPPALSNYQAIQQALDQAPLLFPIPDAWLNSISKFLVQASFKEEDSDYMFTTSKLASYSGRYLSKKRNLVKQLLDNYSIKGVNLSLDILAQAKQILDQWQQEQGTGNLNNDYEACQEALQYFQELNLQGRLIYADHLPVGFTLGEWITKDCFAGHFSKGLRSIKGIYPYLYQDLAQTLQRTDSWINLEQDLGLPALRQAKHSYQPDYLLRKWRVQIHSF